MTHYYAQGAKEDVITAEYAQLFLVMARSLT